MIASVRERGGRLEAFSRKLAEDAERAAREAEIVRAREAAPRREVAERREALAGACADLRALIRA